MQHSRRAEINAKIDEIFSKTRIRYKEFTRQVLAVEDEKHREKLIRQLDSHINIYNNHAPEIIQALAAAASKGEMSRRFSDVKTPAFSAARNISTIAEVIHYYKELDDSIKAKVPVFIIQQLVPYGGRMAQTIAETAVNSASTYKEKYGEQEGEKILDAAFDALETFNPQDAAPAAGRLITDCRLIKGEFGKTYFKRSMQIAEYASQGDVSKLLGAYWYDYDYYGWPKVLKYLDEDCQRGDEKAFELLDHMAFHSDERKKIQDMCDTYKSDAAFNLLMKIATSWQMQSTFEYAARELEALSGLMGEFNQRSAGGGAKIDPELGAKVEKRIQGYIEIIDNFVERTSKVITPFREAAPV